MDCIKSFFQPSDEKKAQRHKLKAHHEKFINAGICVLDQKGYVLRTLVEERILNYDVPRYFTKCFLYKKDDPTKQIEFEVNRECILTIFDEFAMYKSVMKHLSILEGYPDHISGEDYLWLQLIAKYL